MTIADALDLPADFEHFSSRLVADLRRHGLAVPIDSVLTWTQAVGIVGGAGRDAIHLAGRSTLVRRPEDLATYDRAFARWWDGAVRSSADTVEVHRAVVTDQRAEDEPDPAMADDGLDAEASDDDPSVLRWSDQEVLRHRDFAACTPEELREIAHLMRSLQIVTPPHRSRRRRPVAHGGDRIDLRRTARHALRTQGEITRWHRDATVVRPRRLVLLLDVSGSMEPYARALLSFAQVAVNARARHRLPVEAFTIGTRLTRLTRELSTRDPDLALGLAADAVPDWSGGTRLGGTIREFCDRWGAPGVARGATVVILSDGWDRGDPDLLGAQMARLGRLAHRIVWVNPLRSTPGYEPVARGMAAALPHVDRFVDGHDLAALDDLAHILALE